MLNLLSFYNVDLYLQLYSLEALNKTMKQTLWVKQASYNMKDINVKILPWLIYILGCCLLHKIYPLFLCLTNNS